MSILKADVDGAFHRQIKGFARRKRLSVTQLIVRALIVYMRENPTPKGEWG